MRLTIFNGSPRGKGSNTRILLEQFINGFLAANSSNQFEIAYLRQTSQLSKHVGLFEKAEHVLLAFPLYTDAMPGIVKAFIEALESFCGRGNNPSIGFIVQSGFPEPIHSQYVAKYLEMLAKRLGCAYLGTAIKGGVEGIQVQPPWMTKKLFQSFYELGIHHAKTGEFSNEILQKLAPAPRVLCICHC